MSRFSLSEDVLSRKMAGEQPEGVDSAARQSACACLVAQGDLQRYLQLNALHVRRRRVVSYVCSWEPLLQGPSSPLFTLDSHLHLHLHLHLLPLRQAKTGSLRRSNTRRYVSLTFLLS